MAVLENFSRRAVLLGMGAGALVLAVNLPARAQDAPEEPLKFGADAMPHGWKDDPNIFVAIDPDGTVTASSTGLQLSAPDGKASCAGFGVAWHQGMPEGSSPCTISFNRSSAHLGGATPLTVSVWPTLCPTPALTAPAAPCRA